MLDKLPLLLADSRIAVLELETNAVELAPRVLPFEVCEDEDPDELGGMFDKEPETIW